MRGTFLFVLALTACSGPDFAPPGEGDDGEVTLVPISGQVIDSVTRAPVAGITIGVGGKILVTDREGRFDAMVPRTDLSVEIGALGFEHFSQTLRVGLNTELVFPLRRLAPFPVTCNTLGGSFQSVVVDLQGRKTLERWTQSTLTLVSSTGARTVSAYDWGYVALDILRWQVNIPNTGPGLVRVDWKLYDSEGHLYVGSCEPVPAPVLDSLEAAVPTP